MSMKKRIPLFAKIGLLMMSALFMLSACTEEKYYTDPETVTKWDVFDIEVPVSQWQWDQQAGLYHFRANVPELDAFIADEGGLLISRVYNNSYYRPLPYTSYYYIQGTSKTISETVDYEYGPGWIHFYVTASDFGSYDLESMLFKITMWW